jgi:hypothetical protein
LRDRYAEIQALGAEVVVIGTGDLRYAREFVEDDEIPFPVLVDEDATAADAVGVERVGLSKLFALASLPGTARALRAGFRIGRPGKRVNQLGATFILSPGPRRDPSDGEGERNGLVLFRHYDKHPADHAPMNAIFDVLERPEVEA